MVLLVCSWVLLWFCLQDQPLQATSTLRSLQPAQRQRATDAFPCFAAVATAPRTRTLPPAGRLWSPGLRGSVLVSVRPFLCCFWAVGGVPCSFVPCLMYIRVYIGVSTFLPLISFLFVDCRLHLNVCGFWFFTIRALSSKVFCSYQKGPSGLRSSPFSRVLFACTCCSLTRFFGFVYF